MQFVGRCDVLEPPLVDLVAALPRNEPHGFVTGPDQTCRFLVVAPTDTLARGWMQVFSDMARRYGVSDVAIAKACALLAIPKPPRGYWAKKAAGVMLWYWRTRPPGSAANASVIGEGSAKWKIVTSPPRAAWSSNGRTSKPGDPDRSTLSAAPAYPASSRISASIACLCRHPAWCAGACA